MQVSSKTASLESKLSAISREKTNLEVKLDAESAKKQQLEAANAKNASVADAMRSVIQYF